MKIALSNLVNAIVVVALLSSLLFVSSTSSIGVYDPWLDTNDDGMIDMRDIGALARAFGASGEPINKTYLLYYAINMVTELNATFEARLPQREVVSIPAAAFVASTPWHEDVYVDHRYLLNRNDTISGRFCAPVQLPHGVNVTRMYIYWRDNGTRKIVSELNKADGSSFGESGKWLMVHLESPEKDGPGWGYSTDYRINNSTIDNYYQYYISVLLPPSHEVPFLDYAFCYAIIEYEYPA